MKSNKGLKSGIVILVLLLAIGFAAVTTQLFINGTIRIGANQTDFEQNVKFVDATATGAADSTVTGDTAATAQISQDGKSITFTTQILDTIDEESSMTYKVTNLSHYAASLGDMKCSFGTTYDESTAATTITGTYVTVVSGNELTGTVIQPNGTTSESGTVTVTQTRSYAPAGGGTSEQIKFTCRMTATAQEPSN